MGVGSRIEDIVEAVYAYRLSWYYDLHLAVVICLGLFIFYLAIRESNYSRHAYIY